MNIDTPLGELTIELPAQPAALGRLNALLSSPELDWRETSALIEGDMALAAALLKTVNSPQFGMNGRIQTVQQALTFLGTREVASLTYEIGLRAAFPPARLLQPLWLRAGRRGALMERLAEALGLAPWAAHSAGLFQECGKAVLFRHAPERYAELLAHGGSDDAALVVLETEAFGIGHDWLGAALCETWGLAPAAVHAVRHRVTVAQSQILPVPAPQRAVCAVALLANTLLAPAHAQAGAQAQALTDLAGLLAPQLGLKTDWLVETVSALAAAEAAASVPLFR